MTKRILCFGDSNTFGYNPLNCGRHPKNQRWTGILSELLPDCEIIEQGLNNRTGFFKNPDGLKYCGGEYFSIFLQNYRNLDLCIIALGTNDAQFFYKLDKDIARKGIQNFINSVREVNQNTKILIIPPVRIKENILNGIFKMQFDKNSIEISEKVFPVYEQVSKENNCYYFDFNKIAAPSDNDGLHYTKESHKLIAKNLAEFIKLNIFRGE